MPLTMHPFQSDAAQLLFVADPLRAWNIKKDSTYAMMREAQKRGYGLWVCESADLQWQSGEQVMAKAQGISLAFAQDRSMDPSGSWYAIQTNKTLPLTSFDAVLMRKDPPFDAEYFYATHLLEQAEREGAKVFNRPAALRDHPEKLALMQFPQYTTPTLVTRDPQAIRHFQAQHRDVILKPLDGMGGMGIYRVREDELNLGSIIDTLNRNGTQTVMVQKYLPEIVHGDKRVLVIGGEPVPYALARIPQGKEVRGNLAAGGKGVAQELSARDRAIAEHLGPILAQRGLLLVGLDIIGDCLTEINVTSPTCFQEITDQTGCDVAALMIDALERALKAHPTWP